MKIAALSVIAIVCFGGCASNPPTPPPDPETMATLLIYPITDAREKQEPKLKDCNLTRPFGEKFFYPINGRIQNAIDVGREFDAPASAVVGMTSESLRQQQRGAEHYFLATTITRFEYYGASLHYEIESVLIRADDGTVVWKRTNKDFKWLGIIGGVFDAVTERVGSSSKCAFFFGEPLPNTYRQMPKLLKY